MESPKQKPTRLPKGVRLGKDSRFHWEIDRKRDDGTRYRKAGSSKSSAAAGAKYRDALKEFEQGLQSQQSPTFGEWADYCIRSLFPTMKSRRGRGYAPTTFTEYERQLTNNLKPHIGDILLTRLTPEHIDAALMKLKGIENKVKARNVGSKVFDLAEKRRKVAVGTNPFRAVSIAPKRKERHKDGTVIQTIRLLSQSEEKLLLDKSKHHPDYGWIHGVILLGLRLGLRKGEILGLEWSHIDFKAKTIRIAQQRQRISKSTMKTMNLKSDGGGLMIVEPKTDAGFRTIPLPPSCLKWLESERKLNNTRFVIPNTLGNLPREPRKVDNAFRKIVEICKLDKSEDGNGNPLPVPTPHDLRHTFCSRMANDYGVPIQVLAAIAGHSDASVTLGYYVHAESEGIAKAMANVP